jgi:hypothetical protein
MAHFIGYMEGSRGQVSRLGTKRSGMVTQVQGWNFGVKAAIYYNEKTDRDEVRIMLTHGSGSYGSDKDLGTFTPDDFNKP